ncbi:hypothetical protein GZ77_03235 [Endozoicomonas montiporae]|uniref:Translocation and assembly module TamB C-terminal domain-containing protein n=1 Tax=Endozoicomonas montiporae TaxID=1027273 RepID=A0A081NB01_9GAMM|nr:hypothetical protein GZ77_03235 [Endozoicomonas montiporae]
MLLTLLLTSQGNRWLWQIAISQLPQLQGELVDGSLLHGWQFRSLQWHQSDDVIDLTVDIQQLSLSLSAERLLHGELLVESLSIKRIDIVNRSSGDDSQNKEDSGITIPSFTMPLPVEIKALKIDELNYSQLDSDLQLENLLLSARAERQQFDIRQFAVSHAYGNLQANGRVSLSAPYPLTARLVIQPDDRLYDQLKTEGATLPEIKLPDIGISLSGTLTDYQIRLDSKDNQQNPHLLIVDGDLSGSLEQLMIQPLNARWLQQTMSLNGQLGWQNGIEWSGKIKLSDVNPETLLQGYPGQLSGIVATTASMNGQQWLAEVSQLNVSGILRTFPVSLSGQIRADNDLNIKADHLDLNIGSNHLLVNGSINQNWNLTGTLNAPGLTELYPPLSGDLSGDFTLTGNRQSPHVEYRLNADQLTMDTIVVDGLKSQGQLKSLTASDNQAHLQIDALSFNRYHQTLKAIELSLTGNPDAHRLSLDTGGKVLSSHLQLNGSLAGQQWQGTVNALNTQSMLGQWNLQTPFALQATQNEIRTEPFCLTSLPASFCLGKGRVSQQDVQVDFSLNQFDVEQLASFFPPHLQWESELNASGGVVIQKGQPFIHLNAHTSEGVLSVNELEGTYNKLVLNSELKDDRLDAILEFKSPQLGVADLNVQVTDIQQSRLLNGQLTIDHLLLELFQPFIPDTRDLSGSAGAHLTMSGSLHDPLLNGELMISDVSLDSEFCDVNRVDSRMLIQGDSAVISGQLDIGGGHSDLNGTLSWKDGQFAGLLHLTGSDLQCSVTGIGSIWASPDLQFNLTDTPELVGSITIPKARIEIKGLPEQAVSVSDDVKVVGRTTITEEQSRSPIALNTTVTLGDDVRIQAYGLGSKLGGSIVLNQSDDQPLTGQGSVELVEGRYRYLGQDLIIKKGQIIFQGPLNAPFLNLDAIRNPDVTQDNVTVGVKVTGPVKAPEWSVYSNPTLSQQEQFSYLLRGRSIQTEGEGIESALLGYGLGEISQTATKLGDQLGIKDFSVDTSGSGENTQVSVGGYIAPGLRLQYGTGIFNSVSEVKIRYEVLPRVYLQAVSGLGQALDVFYRFDL